MATKLASILDSADSLLLPDGTIIALDSQKFLIWLENNQSFRFDCGLAGKDGYTARKERSGYWYAYKKIGGKLHKRYIGTITELTIPKLLEVAQRLQTDSDVQPRQQLQKEVVQKLQTDSSGLQSEVVQQLCVTVETMQQTITLLVQRIEALEAPKKPEFSPVEGDGVEDCTTTLEKRVNELQQENEELRDEVERLHSRIDMAESGVAVEVIEMSAELGEMQAKLETAQAQLEEAQQLQPDQTQEPQPQPVAIDPKAIDEFLASLNLGKQAPDYKAAKKWAAKFVEFYNGIFRNQLD